MKKSGFLAVLVLTIIGSAPFAPALAQQSTPQSFDQYPGFLELTSQRGDGTQTVLRCGYSVRSGQPASLDSGYREISVINQERKTYSRIQRIDDVFIATSTDPSGNQGLLLELVKPDGSVKAKSCENDANTDSVHNCRTVRAFTFVDQIKAGDERIAAQCGELFKQSGTQINPSFADPQKAEAFKAALRQKVSIMEAP